jgi:hypothetical protein
MRALTLAKNAFGCAAVAAMLVLSSPGVKVVRAGEPQAEESVCREGERVVQALDRAIPAEIRRPWPGPQRVDDREIVVLNTRGYNYPAERSPVQPPN